MLLSRGGDAGSGRNVMRGKAPVRAGGAMLACGMGPRACEKGLKLGISHCGADGIKLGPLPSC
jgi:hypothetical protein